MADPGFPELKCKLIIRQRYPENLAEMKKWIRRKWRCHPKAYSQHSKAEAKAKKIKEH